jgi:hypothetical protein
MHRKTQASVRTSSTFGGVVMIDERELREQIANSLQGELSLDDLYSWVMSRSWNMHKDSLPSAVELAGDVESLFFELSDGARDEESVRRELSQLLNNISVTEPIEITREDQERINFALLLARAPARLCA